MNFFTIFAPVKHTCYHSNKINITMKKQNYTTPVLSIEEFELSEVICTSGGSDTGTATQVTGNVFQGGIQSDENYTGGAFSKQRNGIWDE